IIARRLALASSVDISVQSSADRIVVTVNDDGIGLPPDWSRPGHFGLRGLTERVERLGGVVSVGNREPRGTRLCAEIPLTGHA
ncbi:MAG: sensor histidine kinase, partial [Steroidobacteraceae bacterium]